MAFLETMENYVGCLFEENYSYLGIRKLSESQGFSISKTMIGNICQQEREKCQFGFK